MTLPLHTPIPIRPPRNHPIAHHTVEVISILDNVVTYLVSPGDGRVVSSALVEYAPYRRETWDSVDEFTAWLEGVKL